MPKLYATLFVLPCSGISSAILVTSSVSLSIDLYKMLSDFLSLSTVRILSIMLFYNPSALSESN